MYSARSVHPIRIAAAAAMFLALPHSARSRVAVQQPGLVLLDTAVLQAPLLEESSGIVASRARRGVFWTVNDSGNDPLLFATDSSGADLGYLRVEGARNTDWEDISIGPCTHAPGTCLFIADLGDNTFRRPYVVIYVVPEIDPPTGPADTTRAVAVEDIIVLKYPDQPHDAEALAVTRDWLLVITKDRTGPAVLFRTPRQAAGARTLERLTELNIHISTIRGRLVTGAAVSRNEHLLVVRTYPTIHLFALRDGLPVPQTSPDGLAIPVVETQGEGVCFDDEGRLVLSSERGSRGHAILTRLRLTGIRPP